MIITDQINALPENPLRGKNFPTGPRFPDMSEAYNKGLIRQALAIAEEKRNQGTARRIPRYTRPDFRNSV